MKDNINSRIRKVLIEKMLSEVDPEEIKDDTPLIELGVGVDSVATLELLVALESEFEISIDEEDIDQNLLENIYSIAEYIGKRL
ncbi:MAG TPA: phosphopantetheine-binding protein [Thermodesulfobacteriota bacterium]|jgi:acyl carrier protein